MTIRLISQVFVKYIGQWPIFYGPANLLHVLKTVYSRKVVLGMIDQCHSETDIVNYICSYIIVINFKIFIYYIIFVTLSALALVSFFFFFFFLCLISKNVFIHISKNDVRWLISFDFREHSDTHKVPWDSWYPLKQESSCGAPSIHENKRDQSAAIR